MKNHILPALKLTALCLLFFAILYPAILLGVAQFAPNQGRGEKIFIKSEKSDTNTSHSSPLTSYYYANVGQKFTEDKYFNSRPSAVEYNAASSGGSNKGPSNPEYLATVQARIDTFLKHNPKIKKSQISSELVTASGSGLDPHISLQGALVQVPRIANVRGISEEKLKSLVNQHLEKPLLGFLGTEKINVLKLNLALENLK